VGSPPVPYGEGTVHHYVPDVCRRSPRLIVGCKFADPGGVENDDVSVSRRCSYASSDGADAAGRAASAMPDAFRKAEQAEVTHVMAEKPRECPPASGVRACSDEDPVAPHGVETVAHQSLDVVVYAEMEDAQGAEATRDNRRQVHFVRLHPERGRAVSDGLADAMLQSDTLLSRSLAKVVMRNEPPRTSGRHCRLPSNVWPTPPPATS
jgi:hypothetical protein